MDATSGAKCQSFNTTMSIGPQIHSPHRLVIQAIDRVLKLLIISNKPIMIRIYDVRGKADQKGKQGLSQ